MARLGRADEPAERPPHDRPEHGRRKRLHRARSEREERLDLPEPSLLERPRIVVGSRADLAEGDDFTGPRIAAVTGEGVTALVGLMAGAVRTARATLPEPDAFVVPRPVAEGYRIERDDTGAWTVVGRQAERAVALSDLTNAEALDGKSSVHTIGDGSSNTVMFAEGYTSCYGSPYYYRPGYWTYSPESGGDGPSFRRDTGFYTYTYRWDGRRYVYTPTWNPPRTFQVKPATAQCSGRIPQGLASGGLQVLMGDGTVRMCNAGMSLATWHAALTPNNNDILGSDW